MASSSCTFFIHYVNSYDLQDGKIPTVLLLNLIVWIILISIFLVLRFSIWEYAKSAIIYSQKNGSDGHTSSMTESNLHTPHTFKRTHDMLRERHAFEWIFNFLRISFRDIKASSGLDAYLYLKFEVYLIILMTIYTVISCCFILPVNYIEGKGITRIFERTTITSLTQTDSGHEKLWLHSFVTHMYVFTAFMLMFSYSRLLARYRQFGKKSSHAIMIQHTSSTTRREDIRKHFVETDCDSVIEDITFAYNTAKLHKLVDSHSTADMKLKLYQDILQETHEREWILIGWKNYACICSEGVEAIGYYTKRCKQLSDRVELSRQQAILKPLGIAFVTFSRLSPIEEVLSQYQRVFCHRPVSSVSSDINVNQWRVTLAPHPTDIQWENLGLNQIIWWLRWLILNLAVLAITIFFTTPVAGISIVNTLLTVNNHPYSLNEAITDMFNLMNSTATEPFRELSTTYTTPLLQILFAQFIPLLVSKSCNLELHWTKSGYEKSAIIKTFVFLQMMLLIFPSLSLTSFDLLIRSIYSSVSNSTNTTITDIQISSLLKCAFLPEGGVFFVNYIITSAFFTAFQLLQIPNFVQYLYRKMSARTIYEVKTAKEKFLTPFNFGIQYAWLLVKISIVIAYSTICPLITAGGLLYIIMKFFVDKYNLYYVHGHAGYVGGVDLHKRAVKFFIWSHILLQMYILFLSIIQVGGDPKNGYRSLILFNGLVLSLTVCVCIVCLASNCVQKYLLDCWCVRVSPDSSFADISLLATPDRTKNKYTCLEIIS